MNTEKVKPSNNLYRIMSFDRVVSILQDKKMFFARPSAWDDPHETVLDHENAQSVFGQCWCMKSTSDAMWRIYSQDTLGVRLGTTRARLKAVLRQASASKMIGFKTREVSYERPKDFRRKVAEAQQRFRDDPTLSNAAETLFLKREAFSHEEEYRVVINHREPVASEAKGVLVPVDPARLIRSILFDSRAKPAFAEAFTHYVVGELGFEGDIGQSVLYDRPRHSEL